MSAEFKLVFVKTKSKSEIKPGLAIMFAGLLAVGATSLSQADAYLDALQAADEDGEIDPNTEQKSQGPTENESTAADTGESLPRELSKTDFEAYLQRNFLGSHSFYSRMDNARKDAVYEAYQNNPGIDFIRNEIKQKYLNR